MFSLNWFKFRSDVHRFLLVTIIPFVVIASTIALESAHVSPCFKNNTVLPCPTRFTVSSDLRKSFKGHTPNDRGKIVGA